MEPVTIDQSRTLTGSDLGSLLAQQRTRIQSVCRECGKTIEGTLRKRFCSDLHRVRNYRKRLATLSPYDSIRPID